MMRPWSRCSASSFGQSAVQRVAVVHRQAARIALRDGLERRAAALVALHRDDALCAFQEQRAREAAGTGADLDHGAALERAGGAGDATRQVEIEDEVLAEAFLGAESPRSRITSPSGGKPSGLRRPCGSWRSAVMVSRRAAPADARRPGAARR